MGGKQPRRPSGRGTPGTDHQAAAAARLKAGDESVLEAILAEFGPQVAGLLVKNYPHLSGCQEDVDDILLEALYQLWQNRGVYDPGRTSLRSWFYMLTQHAAVDMSRTSWQKSRQKEKGIDASGFLENFASDRIPVLVEDEPARLSKAQEDVSEIFRNLSIIEQKILEARSNCDDGDHWAADLSKEIGMKPGAIRVRLGRIRQWIIQEMKRRGHNLLPAEKTKSRTALGDDGSETKGGSLR